MSNIETTIPISKLIILYLFKHLDITLNELQVVSILTDNDWANYFDVKENLAELSKADMLDKKETPNGVFYVITSGGKASIDLFFKDIMLSVRDHIEQFSNKNRDDLNRESDLFSDYIKITDEEYRVTLRILENTQATFELNLAVYSKQEAETLIQSWKNHALNIYRLTYTELMNE